MKTNKWIDCKKELPQIYKPVLVMFKGCRVDVYVLRDDKLWEEVTDDDVSSLCYPLKDVYFWAPIPPASYEEIRKAGL